MGSVRRYGIYFHHRRIVYYSARWSRHRHGHFASNEAKVRDYRKLLGELEIFQDKGLGNFRDLTVAVAKSPAMLSFLDAGVNVKGASNENFAREIMELFTMGVGHYTEKDIREAARAFTGWNYNDLTFVVNKDQHDDTEKAFLGHTGNFDGVEVIDIIMQQPATADFIAGKIYKYFVREDLSPELQKHLGSILRDNKYEIRPLLETIFRSRDFYSTASVGTRIQSPAELAVSTYKKLGLTSIPGVPDFNSVTGGLGQQLFQPPTVAGWAQGKAWITPGLLLERGNFARDVLSRTSPSFQLTVIPAEARCAVTGAVVLAGNQQQWRSCADCWRKPQLGDGDIRINLKPFETVCSQHASIVTA